MSSFSCSSESGFTVDGLLVEISIWRCGSGKLSFLRLVSPRQPKQRRPCRLAVLPSLIYQARCCRPHGGLCKWGVASLTTSRHTHNGVSALDGATELCAYLHNQKDKKLMVLSNTSAPGSPCTRLVTETGILCRPFFVGAVTSGEESSRFIRTTYGKSQTTTTASVPKSSHVHLGGTRSNQTTRGSPLPPERPFLAQCGNVEVATCVSLMLISCSCMDRRFGTEEGPATFMILRRQHL